MEKRGIASHGRNYMASMGIYLFKRDVLFQLLNSPPLATDFGREVFPQTLQRRHVQAHLFDGYWEDVGTIKAYHEASLALTGDNPPFDFHSASGVIYTRMRYLPASRISGATLDHCLVSDGCVVRTGAKVARSVLGVRTRIGHNTTIRNTVLIGADRFETDEDRAGNKQRGVPNLTVGDNSVIENAILDKDCRIGSDVRIVNQRQVKDDEGKNFVIRDGIVVIPRAAVVLDGTVI
jgi:glucose-1-phosphate adenylyltransferase